MLFAEIDDPALLDSEVVGIGELTRHKLTVPCSFLDLNTDTAKIMVVAKDGSIQEFERK